jgi:hypothetical protein
VRAQVAEQTGPATRGRRRHDFTRPAPLAFGKGGGRRLLGALLALSLAGCSPNKVSLRGGPREYVATDYEDVLERWTRTEDLITLAELDNLLQTTATFESWDFRWAYVVRYVEDYRLTIEQRKKLLEKTLDETKQGHHFFVAITGGERRFNDLTKPDSAWIVRLIDSTGNETAPEEISIIKRPNAIEQTYYPYITVFHQAFRIRFPQVRADGRPTISPNAEWVGLRFAGAQGNSELRWVLDRDLPSQRAPRAAALK